MLLSHRSIRLSFHFRFYSFSNLDSILEANVHFHSSEELLSLLFFFFLNAHLNTKVIPQSLIKPINYIFHVQDTSFKYSQKIAELDFHFKLSPPE